MTELPSGTVTFLFTDIEGSTRLLKEHRNLYGDLLAEHARMLRAAFVAVNTYVSFSVLVDQLWVH